MVGDNEQAYGRAIGIRLEELSDVGKTGGAAGHAGNQRAVSDIKIGNRHRRDLGDVGELGGV
jgi:hypothetical protein